MPSSYSKDWGFFISSDIDDGIALHQQSANSKGKEGASARNIIDMLTLKGSIVTLNAFE